jgi:hypothetical protein
VASRNETEENSLEDFDGIHGVQFLEFVDPKPMDLRQGGGGRWRGRLRWRGKRINSPARR